MDSIYAAAPPLFIISQNQEKKKKMKVCIHNNPVTVTNYIRESSTYVTYIV